jgi:AraC family transcriptional regulator
MEVSPKGEIGVRSVAGGKFLVFTYIGSYDNLFNVFDTIYRKWIPESNYQLRIEQGFEKYLNTPEKVTPDKLKTEIYIPVV